MRRVFFGACTLEWLAQFCKVDAAVLSRSFTAGRPATSGRREELFSGLRKIKEDGKARFQEMSAVDLVSQWESWASIGSNNVFVMMGQVVETKTERSDGFRTFGPLGTTGRAGGLL